MLIEISNEAKSISHDMFFQIKLSVLTTTKLPRQLQIIKRQLGLTLIKFEDATIELEPFIKKHPFESTQFLVHSIIKHYKDVRL